MSTYTLYFSQTEVQPVTVQAEDYDAAKKLAAKHICRQGYWTLNPEFRVDGELVTPVPVAP